MRQIILKTKACPFCGQTVIAFVCKGKSGGSREVWLECTECGGRSGSVKVPTTTTHGCDFCNYICDDAKQVAFSARSKWDARI